MRAASRSLPCAWLLAAGPARRPHSTSARTRSATTPSTGRSTRRRTSASPSTTASSRPCPSSPPSPRAPTTSSRARLNFQIPDPIPLITYATHAEFEQTNVIAEFIPEGVGAFAVPARNRMVLPVDMPDEQLQQLIQHELTHIFQYEILFQGRLGKAISPEPAAVVHGGDGLVLGERRGRTGARPSCATRSPPTASPRSGAGVQGYFAYRFGHMVFQFVEAEWGEDGLRDFVFEFRNTLGQRRRQGDQARLRPRRRGVRRPLPRLAAQVLPARHRRPRRPARVRARVPRRGARARSYETSPVASPSGDLIAAFSTYKEDVDVVLLGVPNRKPVPQPDPGRHHRATSTSSPRCSPSAPTAARDLAFSPDGDRVAVFARHERGRMLLLLDALNGGIATTIPIPGRPGDGAGVLARRDRPSRSTPSPAAAPTSTCSTSRSGKMTQPHRRRRVRRRPGLHPGREAHRLQLARPPRTPSSSRSPLADPAERRQLTFGPGNDEGACFSARRQAALLRLRPRQRDLRHLRPRPRDAATSPASPG